jgi:hypothetical protein
MRYSPHRQSALPFSPAYRVALLPTTSVSDIEHARSEPAVEQRDAADEGRLETSGSIMVGTFRGSVVIVNEGKVVRPSQLIASVRQTWTGARGETGEAVHARVCL